VAKDDPPRDRVAYNRRAIWQPSRTHQSRPVSEPVPIPPP